jgi:hypothetical protein
MSALDEALTTIEAMARDARALPPDARRRLAARLRDDLAGGALGVRAEVLRRELPALLDEVYAAAAAGGGPTARGLRTLQRLKTHGEPSLRALVLEPVYFAAPARRREVAPELERLRRAVELEATGAGRGLLDRELTRLERRRWSGLRFVPVVLLNRRLASAVRASRRITQGVPRVVALLQAPGE